MAVTVTVTLVAVTVTVTVTVVVAVTVTVTVTVTVVVAVTVTVKVPPPMTAALRSITLCHSTPLSGPSPPKSYITVKNSTVQYSRDGDSDGEKGMEWNDDSHSVVVVIVTGGMMVVRKGIEKGTRGRDGRGKISLSPLLSPWHPQYVTVYCSLV